jgi:hypothetical protein
MDGPTMVEKPARAARPQDPVHVGLCRGAARNSIDVDNVAFPAQALLGAGLAEAPSGRSARNKSLPSNRALMRCADVRRVPS